MITKGWKTTEFWATLLTHAFGIATSIFVLADQPFPDRFAYLQGLVPIAAFVASSAVQAAYSLSRGKVKDALLSVVGAMDDAEAIWHALFPTRPVPPAVTDAAMARRASLATTGPTSTLRRG